MAKLQAQRVNSLQCLQCHRNVRSVGPDSVRSGHTPALRRRTVVFEFECSDLARRPFNLFRFAGVRLSLGPPYRAHRSGTRLVTCAVTGAFILDDVAPTRTDFERALTEMWVRAAADGKSFVDIDAGTLHRMVGGYPGRDHRMRACCAMMRRAMRAGDQIESAPSKGDGAKSSNQVRPAETGCR